MKRDRKRRRSEDDDEGEEDENESEEGEEGPAEPKRLHVVRSLSAFNGKTSTEKNDMRNNLI